MASIWASQLWTPITDQPQLFQLQGQRQPAGSAIYFSEPQSSAQLGDSLTDISGIPGCRSYDIIAVVPCTLWLSPQRLSRPALGSFKSCFLSMKDLQGPHTKKTTTQSSTAQRKHKLPATLCKNGPACAIFQNLPQM